MNGRTLVHRMLHGRESNASTEMRIHLYMSVTPDGDHIFYMWELRNDATGNYWFKRIDCRTYGRIKQQLSNRYRFQWLPVRKESEKAALVFEDVYGV